MRKRDKPSQIPMGGRCQNEGRRPDGRRPSS